MTKTTIQAVLLSSILAVGAGCADGGELTGTGGSGPSTTGSGGNATTTSGGGGQMPTSTGGGGAPVSYEDAVGAAYAADGRIVLIDPSGTRSSRYNPTTGVFESADDIDELEGGLPLAEVVAAATVDGSTYLFDAMGRVTIYDRGQGTFSPPDDLSEVLEDSPLSSVGAAFGLGTQLFVFNEGGSSYAAYNASTETWSPVYSFATDFGGGGAPIASVGAAATLGDGSIMLFDRSGAEYCIYGGNGTFSDDFDITELGDGSLSFNETPGD